MDARPVSLIVDAKWIIPVAPTHVALADHALVVDKGRIVDIQPSNRVDTLYTATERVDRSNHAVMPGLINAHTHGAMTLFRGLADDLPFP